MKKLTSFLPTVHPLHLEKLTTRVGASAGVWLVVLVPLACSPGLYHTYAHCHPTPRLLSLLAIQVGVSGIHLYKQICLSSSSHHKQQARAGARAAAANSKDGGTKEGGGGTSPKTPGGDGKSVGDDSKPGRSPPALLRLVTHPYTPALITAAAMAVLTEIHPAVAVFLTTLCAHVVYRTTHWLFLSFPGSFSLGEGALVGQTAALALTYSLYSTGATILQPQRLSHTQQISALIQVGVVVLALLVVGLYRLPLLRCARMFLPYVCVCGAVGVGAASLVLREWVPTWLLETLTGTDIRIQLLAWWAGLSVFALLLTTWAKRWRCMKVTVLRKVYHLVIVLVFVPGVLLDPTFMHFAAAAATLFCLLLEVVRVEKIEPFSRMIGQAFAPFLDEKDGGPLILSHIYLLVGVSSPLWLTPCPLEEVAVGEALGGQWPASPRSVLPLLSGVLAVGVGDTAASVGGTYFGRRRWAGTKKTVEGSLCGVAAQVIGVAGLAGAGLVAMTLPAWGRLVVAAGLVAALEALTDQVDNIVLPLLLYTPLMDL